jgi:hypothetical protein
VPPPRRLTYLQLPDTGVDQADQVLQRRVQHRRELCQRSNDDADELGLEHVERRQLREALDLVLGDRLACEDAAAESEHLRLLGRVAERLRHGHRIALGLDERDRGRPFQHREQRVGARVRRRTAGQRVLDHGQLGTVLEQLDSQRRELRVREPTVVGHDERVGRNEPRRELLDDSFLVSFLHSHFLRK